MDQSLSHSELFQGLGDDALERLAAIARNRTLRAGEYLFLLGESADCLYVVARGSIDLCFPIALHGVVKDVPVESAAPGKALGWSALVRPYRFTLSARATEPSEVAALSRHDLQQLFDADPRLGYTFLANVSTLVGIRLLTFQALWARELQRVLSAESQHPEKERS